MFENIYPGYPLPPPFPEGEPGFSGMLKTHTPFIPHWRKEAPPQKNTVDLRKGISCRFAFPDPEGLLETAYADFRRFLSEAAVPEEGETDFSLLFSQELEGEDFQIEVTPGHIVLSGSGTEAIRRGLYYLADRIAALETPALPLGTEKKHFWLKNRISRCFFGPIKRAPFFRDELMDDVDYYPGEYLSQLAREGINGLWLTVEFHDLCSTKWIKEDINAQRRLEKLRQTVKRCLRYGIKTWIFCIEPVAWKKGRELPEDAPELAGPGFGAALSSGVGDVRTFCALSDTAEQYLYDATFSIFSRVPDLGGMIILPLGERVSSCLSTRSSRSAKDIPCPKRCSLSAAEIFGRVLNPLFRGLRAANPEAEMIVWPYQPDPCQLEDWIFTLPEKLDKDIIFTYNFESGVNKSQLGKIRCGGDYWLSCTGPSDRFGRMANVVRRHCRAGAKLQVASSHEIATVPYIPVPGTLYRKYRAMKEMGVEDVMQCWYFGNCPGLMNRAAGMLAMEDFADGEENFLKRLAAPEWGAEAEKMVKVWQLFEEAYSFYPLENQFQYYGPMHDGTVWPLHLKQVLRELPRSWKPDHFPAGDVLGEALKSHTAGEAAVLLKKMAGIWEKGMALFREAAAPFAHDPVRMRDLGVAEALGILLASARSIFSFYLMRLALFRESGDPEQLLTEMEQLVLKEIGSSDRLAELCSDDPRLGYHSEAEVAKFHPERLLWRSAFLRDITLPQLAECRTHLRSGGSFAAFARPAGVLECRCGTWYENGSLRWKAERNAEELLIEVEAADADGADEEYMKFYFLDEEGMCFPIPNTGLARRSSEKIDWSEAAELEKEELQHAWRVRAVFPLALFSGAPKILFGIQRVCYTASGERNITWPPGEFTNELRLNLSYFTPDRLCRLDVTGK